MRYVGRRDDPLNRRGSEQAARVAAALAEIDAAALLTSPLRRATETATAIAETTGLEIVRDERLIEMSFGDWEGRSRREVIDDEAQRRRLERWERDPSVAPPGGESLAQVQQRARAFADEVTTQSPGATVIVVSHMGPVKTLLCAALEVDLRSAGRIFLDPATISVVDWGSSPIVRLVNGHGHLGFGNARWMGEA